MIFFNIAGTPGVRRDHWVIQISRRTRV